MFSLPVLRQLISRPIEVVTTSFFLSSKCYTKPFSCYSSKYLYSRQSQVFPQNRKYSKKSSESTVVVNSISPVSNKLTMSSSAQVTAVETTDMGACCGKEAGATKSAFQRLLTNSVPKHYTISIQPNFEDFTFEGSEAVELKINSTSSEIELNAADLTVDQVVWKGNDTGEQSALSVNLDAEREVLTLRFEPSLPPGVGVLKLKFKGTLNDKMKGFYRSKYKGPNGEDRFNGVTQFEATDARRCFPSWDEPAIKATFDISLVVSKDKVALSNMPVKETLPYPADDKLQIVHFDRTPIMSTYLVAFVVGEFDYIETRSADGVLCRVYTPVGKKHQGKFALDVAARVLPYYKDYFGIAYPLPKMDLVAIADFSAGAMENWGLVTYRETCLLVDEEQTSANSKQWVALVVGHELAHQWFGNLVTMDWWTDLWLNEGYASFVEFLCVEHLFPEFDIWTQFVTDMYIRALELDCLKNSHPIEVPVGHPSEIDEIFDDISYSKGAAIIRMLHQYIGDADFKKGMSSYLTRHQYKNAVTKDLWKSLEEASSKPIGDVMSTWTKQMGFPLIKVTAKQDGNNRILQLSQEKFWADPSLRECKETNKSYRWMIPLTFCTARDPTKVITDILMKDEKVTVTIPNVSSNEWIKLNPGTVGYYRVRYPGEYLNQFVPAIQQKTLPPLDRLGLLDDVFAMVQSGQSTTIELLSLLDAFVEEDNYTVWASINNIMGKLNLLFAYTEHHDQFKSYGRRLFGRIESKLGWEPKEKENHLDTMLRSLVLLRMGAFGHTETIEEAKKRFDLHVNGEQTISADLRSAVYRAVLSVGDKQTYDAMLKLYGESDMLEEKDRIARALGAIKDPEIQKQVLQFSISDDVRSQDSVFVIISVGMSKDGREIAWNFFKDNWQLFRDRYPSGHLVARLVKHVTEHFVTEEKAVEVSEFFRNHQFPGTERTVSQTIESIRLNEAWLKRDKPLFKDYLSVY